MRELTYVGDLRVEWRQRPDPRLESRFDAIVRPVADVGQFAHRFGGRVPSML